MRIIAFGALYCFIAASVAAYRPFIWSVAVGADYLQNTIQTTTQSAETQASDLRALAELRFRSALWSPKVLIYDLGFFVEDGRQSNKGTDSNSGRNGYSLGLTLFPRSGRQQQLDFRHNVINLDVSGGSSYAQKGDYWGFRGLAGPWRYFFTYDDSGTDRGWKDNATQEEGEVRGTWRIKDTRASMILRHWSQERSYFNYGFSHDQATLQTTSHPGREGNLWTDLSLQRIQSEDTDLGRSSDELSGQFSMRWRQPWSERWEGLHSLRALIGEESSGWTVEVTERYWVIRPLRLEATMGFVQLDSDERAEVERYPFYKAGLYWDGGFRSWQLEAQGGIRVFARDIQQGGRDERLPYALLSLSGMLGPLSLSLEAAYEGLSAEFIAPQEGPDEIPTGAQVALASDFSRVKTRISRSLTRRSTLTLDSIYQSFTKDELGRLEEWASWNSNLDWMFPQGSLGFYFDQQNTSGTAIEDQNYSYYGARGKVRLNSHLSWDLWYGVRRKEFRGLVDDEEEIRTYFNYAAGKFFFEMQYLLREASTQEGQPRHQIFRAVIKRAFGND